MINILQVSLTAGCIIVLKNLNFPKQVGGKIFTPTSEQIAVQQFLIREEGHIVLGCTTKPKPETTSSTIYIENYTNNGPYSWKVASGEDNIPEAFQQNYNFYFLYCNGSDKDWNPHCNENTSINTTNVIDPLSPLDEKYPMFEDENEVYQYKPVVLDMSLQNNLLFKITTQEMEAAAPIYGVNN